MNRPQRFTLVQLQAALGAVEQNLGIGRERVQPFDERARLLAIQQARIAHAIKQGGLQAKCRFFGRVKFSENDDRLRPFAVAPININRIRRVAANRRVVDRTLVVMKDKIAQAVENRLALVDLNFLQRMRMMPDDEVGAGVDQRMPNLDLVVGKPILKARTPKWRHAPMQRQNDKIRL